MNSDSSPAPFTLNEINKVLTSASDQHRNILKILFHSTLKLSEILSLKKADIDLETGSIEVKQSLYKQEGLNALCQRTVILNPIAANAILAHLEVNPSLDDFVFIDPKTDKCWYSTNLFVKKVYRPAFKISGVKYRQPAHARYSYAHKLLKDGFSESFIARQLGFKSIEYIKELFHNSQKSSTPQ
jgi:integrase